MLIEIIEAGSTKKLKEAVQRWLSDHPKADIKSECFGCTDHGVLHFYYTIRYIEESEYKFA